MLFKTLAILLEISKLTIVYNIFRIFLFQCTYIIIKKMNTVHTRSMNLFTDLKLVFLKLCDVFRLRRPTLT